MFFWREISRYESLLRRSWLLLFMAESIERAPPPAERPRGGSIRDGLSLPSLELGGLALTGILKLALERLFYDLDDLKFPTELFRLRFTGP